MPIWPSDDPAFPLATRLKLFPELGAGYSPNETDYIKRSDPEAGPGFTQILDVWGRTRFVADIPIRARNRFAGILQAFWRKWRTATFTFFDQDVDYHEDVVIGTTITPAATQTLTIPAKEVIEADVLVYVNNVLRGVNDWTLLPGAGSEGQDNLRLDYDPLTAGWQVKVAFMGRRRYIVEFSQPPTRTSAGVDQKQVTYSVREA